MSGKPLAVVVYSRLYQYLGKRLQVSGTDGNRRGGLSTKNAGWFLAQAMLSSHPDSVKPTTYKIVATLPGAWYY